MNDRGMIKWQPFESLISSKEVINSILKKKNEVNKPILSSDQLEKLNELILESYYNQAKIVICYFKSNQIYKIRGTITGINSNMKIITLNNQIKLHISQILQINT